MISSVSLCSALPTYLPAPNASPHGKFDPGSLRSAVNSSTRGNASDLSRQIGREAESLKRRRRGLEVLDKAFRGERLQAGCVRVVATVEREVAKSVEAGEEGEQLGDVVSVETNPEGAERSSLIADSRYEPVT